MVSQVFEHRKTERLRTQALEATTSGQLAPSSSSQAAPSAGHLLHALDVRLEAPAALSQQSGFELLEALHRELSMSSVDSMDSIDTSAVRASQTSVEEEEAREEHLEAEDMKAAEREVDQYLGEQPANANANILEYWEVRHPLHPAISPS